jgi:hypothetical protein
MQPVTVSRPFCDTNSKDKMKDTSDQIALITLFSVCFVQSPKPRTYLMWSGAQEVEKCESYSYLFKSIFDLFT